MFGESTSNYSSQPEQQDRHPHFSTIQSHTDKSNNMQQVLYGTPEVNSSYFVDCISVDI
jgi:hypothetical protein